MLSSLIDRMEGKAEGNKRENEKLKEKVEDLTRDFNKNEKLKEIGVDVYQCQLKLKENKKMRK